MNLNTIVILLIGTALMLAPMTLVGKKRGVSFTKVAPLSLILTVTGTLGTYLWFFVENGSFDGRSFFGAVFIVPVVFVLLPKLFGLSYGALMDMCAPAECIMLALMKAKCFLDGCCGGRLLWLAGDSKGVFFPSQLVELSVAILLCAALVWMAYKKAAEGTVYPWYLILYGITRFILNFFREDWDKADMIVPYGNIWSVLAVVIGVLWLIILKKRGSKAL